MLVAEACFRAFVVPGLFPPQYLGHAWLEQWLLHLGSTKCLGLESLFFCNVRLFVLAPWSATHVTFSMCLSEIVLQIQD